jgi:hypothetical protein
LCQFASVTNLNRDGASSSRLTLSCMPFKFPQVEESRG